METEQKIVVTCGGMDGNTAEEPWLVGKIYLDVCIDGDSISGWVAPQVAAAVKGLGGQGRVDSSNVIGELAQIGVGMEAAGKAMRAATAEISRQKIVIEQYRSGRAAHETMVGRLLELLDADNLDLARDIVKLEYDGIHGPRD